MADLTEAEAAELSAAGWGRVPGTAEHWRDPAGERFPAWRALEVARRDAARDGRLVGAHEVRVDGDRAEIDLGDWSLRSYQRFLKLKGRLSTYEVAEPFRRRGDAARPRIVCPSGDLAALGLEPPAAGVDGAHPAMFERAARADVTE